MDITDIGRVVAKFAPLLGGAIAGPGGAAIGGLVAATFGGEVEKPEELIQKITLDPDAEAKLLEIQAHQKVELQRLNVQQAENALNNTTQQQAIAGQDRFNARQQNIALSAEAHCDHTPRNLTYCILLGSLALIAATLIFPLRPDSKDIIMFALGALLSKLNSIVNFYFGSSAESQIKDAHIMKHLQKMMPVLPNTPTETD